MRTSLLIFLAFFILASCGEQPYFEKEYSFENRKWDQDLKPKFEVKIDDVSKPFNITLFLRTTTDYPYNNLWVYLKTTIPDGTTKREPFEIRISNPDGSWVGTKTGTVVETALYFKERILPQKGTYTFEIEQAITKSTVDEVLDIGLSVGQVNDPEN